MLLSLRPFDKDCPWKYIRFNSLYLDSNNSTVKDSKMIHLTVNTQKNYASKCFFLELALPLSSSITQNWKLSNQNCFGPEDFQNYRLMTPHPPPPRQSDGWVPRSSMVSLKRAHGHWLVLVSSLAEVQGWMGWGGGFHLIQSTTVSLNFRPADEILPSNEWRKYKCFWAMLWIRIFCS